VHFAHVTIIGENVGLWACKLICRHERKRKIGLPTDGKGQENFTAQA